MELHVHKGSLIRILIYLHSALEYSNRTVGIGSVSRRQGGIGKDFTALSAIRCSTGYGSARLMSGNGNRIRL